MRNERMPICLLLVLVTLLVFSAVPVSHVIRNANSSAKVAWNLHDQQEVHIGNGETRTTYFLFQNLTVAPGSILAINDTNLVFVSNASTGMSILDYGSVYLNNTTVSASTPNGSAGISVSLIIGNASSNNSAYMFMKDSSLDFGGSVESYNSRITILNSDVGEENMTSLSITSVLRLSIYNSTFDSSNSTYDCFFRSANMGNFIDGYLNFSYNPVAGPLSWVGYHEISLSPGKMERPDSYVTSLRLAVSYSGNDSAGKDYIVVFYGSVSVENLTLNSTGGTDTTRNASVSVNMSLPLTLESAYNNGITAYYGIDGSTTIEIWNLSITIESNDTESYYGTGCYNMLIHNSTVLSVGDRMNLGFQNMYTYPNIMNPQKNMIIAFGNSSIYLVGDSVPDGGLNYQSPPFLLYNKSNAAVYQYEKLKFMTPYGAFFNSTPLLIPEMIPAGLNLTVSAYNSKVKTLLDLSSLPYLCGQDGSEFIFPLIDSIVNATEHPIYLGNYQVKMASSVSYFSLDTFPFAFVNTSVRDLSISVPYISVINWPKSITVGKSTLQISLESSSPVSVTNASLSISTASGNFSLEPETAQLVLSDSVSNINWTGYISPAIVPGIYDATLSITTKNFTFSGMNFTKPLPLLLLPDLHVKISGFGALANQGNVTVSFNVSNTGLSSSSYNVSLGMNCPGNAVIFTNQTITLNPGTSIMVSFTMYATANISGFVISLTPVNDHYANTTVMDINDSITVINPQDSLQSHHLNSILQDAYYLTAFTLVAAGIYTYYIIQGRAVYYFCAHCLQITKKKRNCRQTTNKEKNQPR